MSKTAVLNRIHELENKLRQVTRFDLWNLWSWEEDEELAELRAKLEEFEI